MKKKVIYILVAVGVVMLIAFKLISNKKELNSKKIVTNTSKIEVPVSVTKVEYKNFQYELVKTGTIIPFEEVNLISVPAGKIVYINFDLGSRVSKGQRLAALDSKLNQLALESTEISVRKLKEDYDRYNSLLEGNATTQTAVNDIKFNYETAVNKAEQIRKQIADATIITPISGIITKRNVDMGEYVVAGGALATIVNVNQLKVRVMVNEGEAYTIKEGQSVKVSCDVFPGEVYTGKVIFISPSGDESHNYPVELEIQNKPAKSLKAGTIVYADFSRKNSIEKALVIPRNALVESIKNPYIYVAEGNIAKQRKINVGREFGEFIEVLGGLKEGETAITTGQINIADGSLIQVAK